MRRDTYCDLVGDYVPGAQLDAYLLRPARVEVAQPQITYLPRLAKLREVLEGGKVAPILVVLPKELPARARARERSISRDRSDMN